MEELLSLGSLIFLYIKYPGMCWGFFQICINRGQNFYILVPVSGESDLTLHTRTNTHTHESFPPHRSRSETPTTNIWYIRRSHCFVYTCGSRQWFDLHFRNLTPEFTLCLDKMFPVHTQKRPQFDFLFNVDCLCFW